MRRPGSTVSFDDHVRPSFVKATPVIVVPYEYREYPRWLRRWDGRTFIEREVRSDEERADLGEDWAETHDEARAIYERQQERIANAAAERAYGDQKLSKRARAEKLAEERDTDQHVTE